MSPQSTNRTGAVWFGGRVCGWSSLVSGSDRSSYQLNYFYLYLQLVSVISVLSVLLVFHKFAAACRGIIVTVFKNSLLVIFNSSQLPLNLLFFSFTSSLCLCYFRSSTSYCSPQTFFLLFSISLIFFPDVPQTTTSCQE